MTILPKLICLSNATPIKLSKNYFLGLEKNSGKSSARTNGQKYKENQDKKCEGRQSSSSRVQITL